MEGNLDAFLDEILSAVTFYLLVSYWVSGRTWGRRGLLV